MADRKLKIIFINMAKIIKPRGDKTHVIVKVAQNIGTEDYTEPYEYDKDYSSDTVSIALLGRQHDGRLWIR